MRAIQSSTLSHLKCTIKIFDTYHIEEEFAIPAGFSINHIVISNLEIVFFHSYLATLNNFMIYMYYLWEKVEYP